MTLKYLKEYHVFEILLDYSKDGINWPNNTPKNNLSQDNTLYIVSIEKN